LTSPKSSTPSLRSLALDHLADLAAALQKADPSLSPQKAVAKAAQTPEGKQAYFIYRQPGSHLPLFENLAHMAKGQIWQENPSLRDLIEAERATPASLAKADAAHDAYLARRRADLEKLGVAKEGGGGGSGPRGGRIEDPVTSGRRTPADTLPSLADAIYAKLRADAIAANPTMSGAQAVVAHLQTTQGQALHAQWAAARQQEAQ
jgi:hypothetical protein